MHHLSTKTQAEVISSWISVAGPQWLTLWMDCLVTHNAKVKAPGVASDERADALRSPLVPYLLKTLLCQGSCDRTYKAD